MKNLKIEYLQTEQLTPYENNAKIHTEEQVEQIKKSIQEFGFNDPIAIWKNNEIIEGHGRLIAAQELGLDKVPVVRLDELTEEQRRAYMLVHNKLTMNTDFDIELLDFELSNIADIDMSEFGFYENEEFEEEPESKFQRLRTGVLRSQFIAPPFSVLDSRQGYWKDRKMEWRELLPDSRDGRASDLLGGGGLGRLARSLGSKYLNGTSEFDPVLCEIIYQWFAPEGGTVIDPFAGGHTRGTIADVLGFKYLGIDLRPEQIDANNAVKDLYKLENATWICDDSLNIDKYVEDDSVDFIISCPPYADLEVYSDDPRDISNMDYEDFIGTYEEIIKRFIKKLKNNSFAAFVVGDVRGKDGFYYDFISDTKKIFINNGMGLYNEIILIESMATAAVRKRNFVAGRKVIKGHQNLLVFYKGEPADQKKHVLVFYKGNPKEIKEFKPLEDDIFSVKNDEEAEEAVEAIAKAVNKAEEEIDLEEDE